MTRLRLRCILTLTGCLAAGCATAGATDTDREAAESRLKQVTQEIGALRAELDAARTDHRSEQQRLQQLDLAIQNTNLELRRLEQQRREHSIELASLNERRDDFLATLDKQMNLLQEQLRAAYRLGKQSRMKLVLNQDDPARLGRMLAYYDYLSYAQTERISGLREALAGLERLQASIDGELQRIDTIQQEQVAILEELNGQRLSRASILQALTGQIDSGEARLRELERNRADLEALLERLADVLADIPADLGARAGIAARKGRLPMPVDGPVRHAFGQSRGAGLRWQGWLIGAQAGREVNAVAYGRVAFADWLRGYGLLLIIDHGQGYLSLYANNESLLHEVGAWVEPGQVISTVGSNPGNEQGLYFELRKDGAAVDPAAWLKR